MINEIAQAYKELADAQAANDDTAATAAFARLAELIETASALSEAPALPAIPEVDSKDNLTVSEKRDEVMTALYDAATSGNVPAALKWIELHQHVHDEPSVDATGEVIPKGKKRRRARKPKRPKKKREDKITFKEGKFLEFYFGDSAYNGTDAARKAGYKGSDNVLAVTAHDILRKPKIKRLIEARANQFAMPMEQVFRLLGDQARGSIEFFLDMGENETPALSLKRAKEEGKLHLIKNITFYPQAEGGGVKHLAWYSAMEAAKTIGNLHRRIQPKKPKDEVGDTPEEAARALEQARDTAKAAIDRIKQKFHLSTAEAAKKALPFFPAAKEFLNAVDPEPEATPAVN